ncbi:MAG: DUF302 domain-containing protein, partial [Bacteroidota bacterium]
MTNFFNLRLATFILVVTSFSLVQCQEALEILGSLQDQSNNRGPQATKLVYSESESVSAATVYERVVNALEANTNIGIVAEVNHQSNAASVNLDLPPTRVVLFGNPNLGTPIMQANQLAGLDLPQKMLVYENGKGRVFAAYNSADYLAERHGVGDVPTLSTIEQALTSLIENTTEGSAKTTRQKRIKSGEGVVTVASNQSFEDTYDKLKSTIDGNPNLRIVAELDHQANAASVGLDLNPTRLIVFGNPNLGTPLMQESQTIGIDLPQKMLVYETEAGEVYVA